MSYTLILGSKNYSSWSLRAYLAMRTTNAPFSEITIPLYQPDTKTRILSHSPSGKVPALQIEGIGNRYVVWDSLAICETLAERHPTAHLWPQDAERRAYARAFAAEMHSGFVNLRDQLPMDFARTHPLPALRPETEADIARIMASWTDVLTRYGGPFLFGTFSIADVMYAPVVSRFHTYGVSLTPAVAAYGVRMLAHPAMQTWMHAAKSEIVATGDI